MTRLSCVRSRRIDEAIGLNANAGVVGAVDRDPRPYLKIPRVEETNDGVALAGQGTPPSAGSAIQSSVTAAILTVPRPGRRTG
jgi:hypothetical protein